MSARSNERTETVSYILTESAFVSPEGGRCRTYGLCAVQNGEILQEISDVDPDRAFVHSLAQSLTEQKAALCHFHDVVEDALGERYSPDAV